MSEEIRKIVNMLSDGRINNDEAVRLLEAATKTAPADLGVELVLAQLGTCQVAAVHLCLPRGCEEWL